MFSLVNICFPKIYTLMDTFIVSCWILKNYFEQSFPCSRYEIISALSRDQIRISYCQFGIRAMRITVRCNLLSRKKSTDNYFEEFCDPFPIIKISVWQLPPGHYFPNQHPKWPYIALQWKCVSSQGLNCHPSYGLIRKIKDLHNHKWFVQASMIYYIT